MRSDLVGGAKSKHKREYPYLGVDTKAGRVVLFTEFDGEKMAILLHDASEKYGIGMHAHVGFGVHEEDYELLRGEVVLSND